MYAMVTLKFKEELDYTKW